MYLKNVIREIPYLIYRKTSHNLGNTIEMLNVTAVKEVPLKCE